MNSDSAEVVELRRQIEEIKANTREEHRKTAGLANQIAEMTAEKWVVVRSVYRSPKMFGVSSIEASRWSMFRFRLIRGQVYLCKADYEMEEEVGVRIPIGGSITVMVLDLPHRGDHDDEEEIQIIAFDDREIAQTYMRG